MKPEDHPAFWLVYQAAYARLAEPHADQAGWVPDASAGISACRAHREAEAAIEALIALAEEQKP